MHSSKSSLLQSSNTALSDYQRATLQTMGIPLYERRAGISLFDSLSLPSEQSAGSAASSTEKARENLEVIDEANDFIKQVLSVFAVSNTGELGLIWQVHDSETISLNDNILITPHAEALTEAASKKQLWKTLEFHFKAQGWS